jgi:hypothetical protein
MTVIESPRPTDSVEAFDTQPNPGAWSTEQFPDGSYKISKGLIAYRVEPPTKPVQVGSASSEPMLSEPDSNTQTLSEWVLSQATNCKQLLFDYNLIHNLDLSNIKEVKKGFFKPKQFLLDANGNKLSSEQTDIYYANKAFKEVAEGGNQANFDQYISAKITAAQKAIDEIVSTRKKIAQNKGEPFNPSDIIINPEPMSDILAEKQWAAITKAVARQVYGYKTEETTDKSEPIIDLTKQE